MTSLVQQRARAAVGERVQTLLEAAPDAMVIIRANGRIVLVNIDAGATFYFTFHGRTERGMR